MGKTLGTILTIAAIAAFAVVTAGAAIGIAAGVSVAASVEASVFALGSLTGLGATIAGGLAIAGLSAVASAIAGTNLPKPETTVTALKTALPPRVAGYGRIGSFGASMLYETSGSGVAVDVFAFFDTMGIPYDGIERVYLGDNQVGTGAGVVSGLADGAFGSSAVEIALRLGAQTETSYSQVTTLLGSTVWDSSHRGDGIVSGMVTWKPVKSKNYLKVYPNGQPSLRIVARTQRCFDWRVGGQSVSNPATWTFTENPWLHYAHYVLTREKTLPPQIDATMSGGAIAAEITAWHGRLADTWDRFFVPTLAFWTAAANDAETAVSLAAGGTEARYRCCLTHKLTDPHKDTKARILGTCDGWVAPRQDGALVAYAGRYYVPTVDIGPDEIISYSLQEGVEDEQAVNSISISYVSSAHDYNTVEATPWEDADDIAFRGQVASSTMTPDVPSPSQGRRLAKRFMARAMAPKRGSCTTNSGGRAARGQRYINLELVEAGAEFFSGPVEITALTINIATGGVTFTWVEVDPSVDAWNPATEEGSGAPVGDVVAPEPLDTPVITAATASFAEDSAANTSGVRISLTIDAPDRPDLTWYVRTQTTGAATWDERTYSDLDPGPSVSIITEFVAASAMVDVETAYQVGDGRFSEWSATETVDTSTAGLAPTAPAGLSATGHTGNASIDWTNSTSNFSYSRVYRGTTSSFGSATQVSGDLSGGAGSAQSYTDTVAAGTYYWWVRAYSAAGAPSTASGPATATVS